MVLDADPGWLVELVPSRVEVVVAWVFEAVACDGEAVGRLLDATVGRVREVELDGELGRPVPVNWLLGCVVDPLEGVVPGAMVTDRPVEDVLTKVVVEVALPLADVAAMDEMLVLVGWLDTVDGCAVNDVLAALLEVG